MGDAVSKAGSSLASWTAPAERSDDGAFPSRGAVAACVLFRSAGYQSGVALRLPPQSKKRAMHRELESAPGRAIPFP